MKWWEYLMLFAGMLFGLQGCTAPIVRINPVELPQYGLDFKVVLDKETYQIGEPVIIKTRVKNLWNKPRTLKILPNEQNISFKYVLTSSYDSIYYLSNKIITLNIPSNKEVEINEMTWIWDQTDKWLKEFVVVGEYFIDTLQLTNVEIDGQLIGSVQVKLEEGILDGYLKRVQFKIIHPVIEKLKDLGIYIIAEKDTTEELINIKLLLTNFSEQQQTVSIKPIGVNPIIRIRILGPVSEENSPILRIMHNFTIPLLVTISPKNRIKFVEFIWDFRDQATGELVPNGSYIALIEFCGIVEVNKTIVGTIENPIKIGVFHFKRGNK